MKPLVYKKAKRVRHAAGAGEAAHHQGRHGAGASRATTRASAGRVLRVIPKTGRVTIEGVNMVKRHRSATQTTEGGDREFAAPIHHSKAMLIDPKSGEPTRIRRRQRTPMEPWSGSP